MKRTKKEILDSINAILGENQSDEALALIEDVSDTISDTDETDWKQKYEENDAEWRRKYKERFFNTAPNSDPEPPEPEEKQTFEELFSQKGE